MDISKCEKCEYYLMIDSGYGYCRRFPPKSIVTEKHFWSKPEAEIKYQLVEWCRVACGEFKKGGDGI